MRACIVLFLASVGAVMASENAQFWGTWEPRPMLREFWRPVTEKWWSCDQRGCGPDMRLRKRCAEFARTHGPENAVPALIADLGVYASEANELVYFSIMAHWPRQRVLRTLESLRHSADPGTRSIIEETLEDFREFHQ